MPSSAHLSVVGGGGSTLLNVNDQGATAAQSYYIVSTFVQRSGAATIGWNGVEGVTVKRRRRQYDQRPDHGRPHDAQHGRRR